MNNERIIHKTVLGRNLGIFISAVPPEEIFSFQFQDTHPVIWHYNILHSYSQYQYYLAFTGDIVDIQMWKYIATAQDSKGLVWHLFSDISREN
jgi:hypothetical protein